MSELSADNRVLTGMKTKIQTQQIRNFRYLIMWCGLLLTGLLLSVAQSVSAAGIETAQLSAEQRAHISELPSILTAEQTITDDIPFDDRVVVVTFFASWCPPCLKEMPYLEAIHRDGVDGVQIVAVNLYYDQPVDVHDYIKREKFTLPVALDLESVALRQFTDKPVVPSHYLVDANGKILLTHLGEIDEAGIRKAIAEHL